MWGGEEGGFGFGDDLGGLSGRTTTYYDGRKKGFYESLRRDSLLANRTKKSSKNTSTIAPPAVRTRG